MTIEEEMAIAVLKGDHDTALMLADKLLETYNKGGRQLPVLKTLVQNAGRLKAIVYLNSATHLLETDAERIRREILRWMKSKENTVITINGVDKIELYQFPEALDEGK